MPKGTSQGEVMSISEKIKPVVLAVIELCLSEGIIRQLVNRNSIKNFFKFRSNLLKAFRVNLKACSSFVFPASLLPGKSKAGFWVVFFHRPCLLLCGPYYTVQSYCMMLLC